METRLNNINNLNHEVAEDIEQITTDLKRPFRGSKLVEILGYVVGLIVIGSVLV
ncbi:hypothetical protein [Methanotorris igneus]|uniref:Tetrahydromethanopterin S-methyltransferase n=1 Tax=Methanotorris igneus (strain DSM 5666 / JCM 11834 / Kol 5) TaxID=880724 RepID=F6BED0_METIK|nr:hypothetical protein [Methanotorris igneus]AEF96807.1 hypothetical protein Metig_1270 [Methanotorris igneus Kol 5]